MEGKVNVYRKPGPECPNCSVMVNVKGHLVYPLPCTQMPPVPAVTSRPQGLKRLRTKVLNGRGEICSGIPLRSHVVRLRSRVCHLGDHRGSACFRKPMLHSREDKPMPQWAKSRALIIKHSSGQQSSSQPSLDSQMLGEA